MARYLDMPCAVLFTFWNGAITCKFLQKRFSFLIFLNEMAFIPIDNNYVVNIRLFIAHYNFTLYGDQAEFSMYKFPDRYVFK